jgi:hypothetical protein
MGKCEKGSKHTSKKVAAGAMIALLLAIGVTGCGTQQANSSQQTQTKNQSAEGQSGQGNGGQGQGRGQMAANPAMRAAQEIMQLQRNQQYVLTSDQVNKIKPILQELISTSNPTEEVLQKQADAIKAVFTDQQKSFLTQQPSGPNRNSQNNPTNPSNNSNNSGNPTPPSGANAPSRNGARPANGNSSGGNQGSFNPQDIYQRALDALK